MSEPSVLLDALQALEEHPPTAARDDTRAAALRAIGAFFEQQVRPGGPYDLRTNPRPVWAPIEERLARALRDLRMVSLPAGACAVHQWYNCGIIVRTPGLTVGFDVIPYPRVFGWPDEAGLEDGLASALDALVVTHRHKDHFDPAFTRACLARGKPVFLPAHLARDWNEGRRPAGAHDGWEAHFRGVRFRARSGFHVWRDRIDDPPLVYYETVLPGGWGLLFGGDLDYTHDIEVTPGVDIRLFFPTWRSPNRFYEPGHADQRGDPLDALQAALKITGPCTVLFQHYGELEHVYDGLPASYELALDLKARLETPSEVMFWGESMVFPGV